MVETLSKNITRQGLTATTLNYLRVSMQEMKANIEDLGPSHPGGPGQPGGHPGGPIGPPHQDQTDIEFPPDYNF